MKIREFNLKSMNPPSLESDSENSVEDEFWLIQINYDHEFLEIDRAPFSVMEETSMSKIHFLFTMLNLSQLFVIRKGVLIGIITKNDFLKKKRMVADAPTQIPGNEEENSMNIPLNPVAHNSRQRMDSSNDQ